MVSASSNMTTSWMPGILCPVRTAHDIPFIYTDLLTLFFCSIPYAPMTCPPNDLSLIDTTDGSEFKGERLTVQFARGPRRKEAFPGPSERNALPRPRRTIFRMQISGLPETSWQVSSPSPFLSGVPDIDSSTPSLYSAHTCFQSIVLEAIG